MNLFTPTLAVVLVILYVWKVVSVIREERARKWAYEHRDPEDQQYWSVDEWADYYYQIDHPKRQERE